MNFILSSFFLLFTFSVFSQTNETKNERPKYKFFNHKCGQLPYYMKENDSLTNEICEFLHKLRLLPIDQTIDFSKKYKHIYTSSYIYTETLDSITGDNTGDRKIECFKEDPSILLNEDFVKEMQVVAYDGKYVIAVKTTIVNKTEEYHSISEYFYRLDEKIYCFVLEE